MDNDPERTVLNYLNAQRAMGDNMCDHQGMRMEEERWQRKNK
jgi:hypothetical protein